MNQPDKIRKLRDELIQHEQRDCDLIVAECERLAKRNPIVAKAYRANQRDTFRSCLEFCNDIRNMPDENLIERHIYQYTAVDEASRWTFRMLFFNQNEATAQSFISILVACAPFTIKCVQTDNGSEFTSKYMKNHEDRDTLFEQFLIDSRIRYRRIQPGRPWHNGMVEVQHRLDREHFYATLFMESIREGQDKLMTYNMESNLLVKKCLDWRSPLSVLEDAA